MATLTASTPSDDMTSPTSGDDCPERDHWIYFLSSSLITFAGGLTILLLIECIALAYNRSKTKKKKKSGQEEEYGQNNVAFIKPGLKQEGATTADSEADGVKHAASPLLGEDDMGCMESARNKCELWISSQSLLGKVVLSMSVVLSGASFMIYIVDATRYKPEDLCKPWDTTISQYIDFALNIFFLITFLLKLFAAKHKLKFWVSVQSLVEFATIPPAFVGIILQEQWLGLRFMRGLRMLQIPELLQYLSILRTNTSIRFADLACVFLSVWLCGAGFVHVVEVTGDMFNDYNNAQNYTYWEYVYFLMVTMSTVGYGDIYCHTLIGRIFIVFFIAGALALFASVIPVVVDIVESQPKYGGEFEPIPGVSHVVVCGHINYYSVTNFLQDFMHEDRIQTNMKYVFIDDKDLSLDMAALFKRHFRQIQYLKGTIMNCKDIRRTKLETAEACIVLANHQADDPDEEDANNIMRIISVKNSFPEKRVLVQLLRYHNKSFCLNLPNWGSDDIVICSSEIKLGLMAQGSVAPGSSTLLSNLFVARSAKQYFDSSCKWMSLYSYGAGLEVYTTTFSPFFYGQSFPKAVKFCYEYLDIMLIACVSGQGPDQMVQLNPGPRFKIREKTKGFVVCDEESEVNRVKFYCNKCHKNFIQPESVPAQYHKIKLCPCPSRGSYRENGMTKRRQSDVSAEHVKLDVLEEEHNVPRPLSLNGPHKTASNDDVNTQQYTVVEKFDSMGLFYWCHERDMSDYLLNSPKNKEFRQNLREHIIVCVFKSRDSPVLGISNFIMPLRSSNLQASDIVPIVLVGEEAYLRKEWASVHNMPEIYVMPGHPTRSLLREINLFHCQICVVMSGGESKSSDSFLKDKEAILCSLDIKTMRFHLPTLSSQNWKKVKGKFMSPLSSPKSPRALAGDSVTMLTEFVNDGNVQFLDQDDDDDPDCPLYLTQPFSCGRAFTASVLGSILCTAFFNHEVLGLIRALVTGTTSSEVETVLAEGTGLKEGVFEDGKTVALRNRCRLALIKLHEGILAPYGQKVKEGLQVLTYQQLFVQVLDDLGVLCLGLYRFIDAEKRNPTLGPKHRFVATNPPKNTVLFPSDQVYVLIPFSKTSIHHPPAHDLTHHEYKTLEVYSGVLADKGKRTARALSEPSPMALYSQKKPEVAVTIEGPEDQKLGREANQSTRM